MKPLLDTKITPATKDGLGDWIPAKDQATLAGLRDFEQRQRIRREQAKQAKVAESANVTVFNPEAPRLRSFQNGKVKS